MIPILHKNKVIDHLINLDSESKYLRFGYSVTDDAIKKYVESSFESIDNSTWFGYIDEAKCVGAIHVVVTNDIAELGISIDADYRGKKLSSRLFDHVLEYLKSKKITKVYMQCLSENTIIQYLAKKYRMKVSNLGAGEKEANAELEIDNQYIHKISSFTNECLGLVDACIRHHVWLSTSLNSIFNLSYLYKE